MVRKTPIFFTCYILIFFSACAPAGTVPADQANVPAGVNVNTNTARIPADSKPITRNSEGVIIDSALSLEDAIGSGPIPDKIRKDLVLLDVRYYSFDGELHQGQLVIHKSLKEDIAGIFSELEKNKFPIAKAIPVAGYDFPDDGSMIDDNTAAFNYRMAEGSKTRWSNHATGRAIDINPHLNPYRKGGVVKPPGATYDPAAPGTITRDSFIVKAFKKRGWRWGGDWVHLKDYQHFEKVR